MLYKAFLYTASTGLQVCCMQAFEDVLLCRYMLFFNNNKATSNIYKVFKLFGDEFCMTMQAYAAKGVHKMYPWQAAALECGKSGNNLVYCAPTSGGKSLVAEILLIRRISNTKRPGRPHGGFHVSTYSALPRL